MKKILVFGTFDIFHEGHKHFLCEAKKQGDWLRVVVARDVTVLKVKKRLPLHDENLRKKIIERSGLANEVVLGNKIDKFVVVRKYQPNIICLGYDQQFFVEQLEEKLSDLGLDKTIIMRIGAHMPEIYKSSKLRKHIKEHGV